MYSQLSDKGSIKGKNNDIRIEISENIKHLQSVDQFVNHLRLNGHFPLFDQSTKFRISFALKKDFISVGESDSAFGSELQAI